MGLRLLIQMTLCEQNISGGWHVLGQPHAFGHGFVNGDARSHDARTGVGNAQQFERTLHGAVFTESAVQCNETPLETFFFEIGQIAFGWIESMGIDTTTAQGIEHAIAGHERDVALGGFATHQDGHLTEMGW